MIWPVTLCSNDVTCLMIRDYYYWSDCCWYSASTLLGNLLLFGDGREESGSIYDDRCWKSWSVVDFMLSHCLLLLWWYLLIAIVLLLIPEHCCCYRIPHCCCYSTVEKYLFICDIEENSDLHCIPVTFGTCLLLLRWFVVTLIFTFDDFCYDTNFVQKYSLIFDTRTFDDHCC